jgi:hypothetical protein
LGGLTNLTGTFGGGKEAKLVGLPSTQEIENSMISEYTPQIASLFASGGSTTTGNSSDTSGVLDTLTPTFAKNTAMAKLLGVPNIQEAAAPLFANQYSNSPVQAMQEATPVVQLADGGGLPAPNYDYVQTGYPHMTPTFGKGHATGLMGVPGHNVVGDMSGKLIGMPGALNKHADGGHIPEFYSEGGVKHRYVTGDGDGTSDSVPAMLATGEFVIPADVVSGLGNGNNESGAKILDEFLKTIRAHRHSHSPKQLPPDSKGPLGYLLDAKRKVK